MNNINFEKVLEKLKETLRNNGSDHMVSLEVIPGRSQKHHSYHLGYFNEHDEDTGNGNSEDFMPSNFSVLADFRSKEECDFAAELFNRVLMDI